MSQQQRRGDKRRGWDVTDVFLGSLAALHAAAAGPAPLLRDRRLKLVPAVGGFRLPSHYHWLLLPFSRRKVWRPILALGGKVLLFLQHG